MVNTDNWGDFNQEFADQAAFDAFLANLNDPAVKFIQLANLWIHKDSIKRIVPIETEGS